MSAGDSGGMTDVRDDEAILPESAQTVVSASFFLALIACSPVMDPALTIMSICSRGVIVRSSSLALRIRSLEVDNGSL